jgi:hypothetical protein
MVHNLGRFNWNGVRLGLSENGVDHMRPVEIFPGAVHFRNDTPTLEKHKSEPAPPIQTTQKRLHSTLTLRFFF